MALTQIHKAYLWLFQEKKERKKKKHTPLNRQFNSIPLLLALVPNHIASLARVLFLTGVVLK